MFLLASVVEMQAQDTLYSRSLKSNYLAQTWVIDTMDCTYAHPTHNYFCDNCKLLINTSIRRVGYRYTDWLSPCIIAIYQVGLLTLQIPRILSNISLSMRLIPIPWISTR